MVRLLILVCSLATMQIIYGAEKSKVEVCKKPNPQLKESEKDHNIRPLRINIPMIGAGCLAYELRETASDSRTIPDDSSISSSGSDCP